MDNKFQRKSIKFLSKGIQISKIPNLVDEFYYVDLNNIRTYQDGVLHSRGGIAALTSSAIADTPIHSIKRINNDLPGASQSQALIVGAGTKLYSSNANFLSMSLTLRDSGYSGGYLSMVPHRPTSSPEPWVYIGDSSRMRKTNVAGTNYPIGIAPPASAISATIGAPIRKVIDDFDTAASWTQAGTAGAPTATANNRVNTTIAAILYDSGTTGWALIKPTAYTTDIQPGLRLTFGAAAETSVIERVFNSITDSTIGSITYDSGSTGLCTIQLAAPAPTEISLNQMLYNSTRTEYIRILSVTVGADGNVSFRCSTVSTFVAADTIQGHATFRCYLTGTRAVADALKATYTTTAVTAGIGYLSQTVTLDLSVSASSGRAFSDDDEIHCSVRIDDLTKLTEGRLYLDVDGATNDFTRNYFYFPFRANDLTSAVANLQTTLAAQQLALQRQVDEIRADNIDRFSESRIAYYDWKSALTTNAVNIGDDYGPGPFGAVNTNSSGGGGSSTGNETASGTSQWSELRFKVKDLIRVGSDTTKGLKDVKALRCQVNVTGNVNFDIDSWWIGGSYGPDALDFPVNYRTRYRSSLTGAVSNPSPPLRTSIEPHREQVNLSSVIASSDGQVDYVDIFRIGGTLLDWTYIGTVANGTTTFSDIYLDDEVLSNQTLEFDNFQPFAILDIPRTGTCNVSGTKVTRASGDTFNTSWAPGSIIIIDGTANVLYSSPTSTSALEIAYNAGTKSAVTFLLPAPTLMAQPLPLIFGPYGGGETGVFIFGVGAPQQPGTLFWTKGNNPDSASESNQLEITSPSEQLMTGCIFDGRPYVFTTERMYLVNRNIGGAVDFTAQEIANSRGVISRWSIAVGDKIYFVSRDGVYETDGGPPTCITDGTLYNLFFHDVGDLGFSTGTLGGLSPIFSSQLNSAKLAYSNGYLYLTYKTSSTDYTVLIYDTKNKSWFRDVTTPQLPCYYAQEGNATDQVLAASIHSPICGGANGKIYRYAGTTSDVSTPFTARVLTRFEDMGDPRAQKLFRDILLDLDTRGTTTTIKVYIDNDISTPVQTSTIATGSARVQSILDLNSGAGYLAKTIALEITASEYRLYEWAPSWVNKAEKIESRYTDWTDAGTPGDKRITGFQLDADTFNAAKGFQLQYDGGTVAQAFSFTHNGQKRTAFALTTPIVAKLLRISATDEVPWYIEDIEWMTEPYPEFLPLKADFDDDNDPRAKWLQGFELDADTGGSNVTITILGDGGTTLEAFTANHNGRTVVPYSFTPSSGQVPITHLMKLVPSGNIRVWKIRWVWKPESELAKNWISPIMTFQRGRYLREAKGFFHLRDCYVAHRSTANISFVVNVDGTDTTLTIPHSNGTLKKAYLVFPPLKGKMFQFRLTSPIAFRLYGDDSEVRAKMWGADEYSSYNPFGIDQDWEHTSTGAEI